MKKVVFLPCHPNMWDGFETIWKKETNTPSNDVKVIPVPTYQRGYNNNLFDAEYITTGYPDNVIISELNDYNLASEHPDTIYIQNIQDTDNPVFVVHPHFHTVNLKSCTDNLVYIPYNCLPEIDIDHPNFKKIYTKILAPSGINNVDKIIVHSQNLKDVYLKLICGDSEELRHQWENKITCKGYPRIEILNQYSKNTIKYPPSWNRHLFDLSSNRKRTVLFATSIIGILENNRNHLKNAKELFLDYIEKKDRVALIWRPNRFIPELLMKLRPELFDDFKSLLEFYISNDVGILDETPTPTPAIILSDAYIGDNCGVKELFSSTGKPILHPLPST